MLLSKEYDQILGKMDDLINFMDKLEEQNDSIVEKANFLLTEMRNSNDSTTNEQAV